MSARIVEDPDDLPGGTDLESALLGDNPAAGAPEVTPAPGVLSGDDVPEKYQGKSARELLDIAMNQEQMIGSHGQKIGELNDRIGTLQGLTEKALAIRDDGHAGRVEPVADEKAFDADDFALNPEEAVTHTVRRETKVQGTRLDALENKANALDFESRHATAATDLSDPNFIEFVKKSPYRSGLAARAFADTENIDFNSADELWMAWEEHKLATSEPTTDLETIDKPDESSEEAPTADMDQASLISGGAGGNPGGSGKKEYSASALAEILEKNPDYYWRDDVQKVVTAAYADGRVKDDQTPSM